MLSHSILASASMSKARVQEEDREEWRADRQAEDKEGKSKAVLLAQT